MQRNYDACLNIYYINRWVLWHILTTHYYVFTESCSSPSISLFARIVSPTFCLFLLSFAEDKVSGRQYGFLKACLCFPVPRWIAQFPFSGASIGIKDASVVHMQKYISTTQLLFHSLFSIHNLSQLLASPSIPSTTLTLVIVLILLLLRLPLMAAEFAAAGTVVGLTKEGCSFLAKHSTGSQLNRGTKYLEASMNILKADTNNDIDHDERGHVVNFYNE